MKETIKNLQPEVVSQLGALILKTITKELLRNLIEL